MGIHMYLETAPNSGVFNYRGEPSGVNADPQGFKRVMARSGHRVIILNERLLGNEVAGIPGGSRTPSDEQLAGRNIPLSAFVEASPLAPTEGN